MKRSDWQAARLAGICALGLALAACNSDDSGLVVSSPDSENSDENLEETIGEEGEEVTGDSEFNPNLETISIALDSASTVPPANVDGATGNGSFSVDTETGVIAGSVTVSGTTGQANAAHIHAGAAGTTGDIVIGLEGNEDGTVWTVPADATLDAAGIALFEAGELYVNVHTEANAPGELRSQLVNATTPPAAEGSITVTLTNTAQFQPLTPPVVILHNAPNAENGIRIFEVGQPAISQLVSIAEYGDFQPMVELADFQLQAGVVSESAVGFADADNPGPLLPGASATINFDLESDDQVMTIISMVVCTNDGFTGIDSYTLPAQSSETFTAPIYDAGSETNVLTLDYWVPACSADAVSPNSGDEENGAITAHPGQSGSENPDFDFAAGSQFLEVTVTRN